MKKVKKIAFLDHGIFPGHTCFCVGYNYDEIIFELNKMYGRKKDRFWVTGIMDDKELIDSGDNFGLRREIENLKTGERKDFYYVILKKWEWSDEDYCKLAHEFLHICQFFLKRVLDRNKEIEGEAYFHTHLMG